MTLGIAHADLILVANESKSDELYPYKPSFALAVVFGAAFSLAFLSHLIQYARHKAWFMYFILLGVASKPIDRNTCIDVRFLTKSSAMELVGYWARTYSAKNLDNFASFSVAYLLVMY